MCLPIVGTGYDFLCDFETFKMTIFPFKNLRRTFFVNFLLSRKLGHRYRLELGVGPYAHLASLKVCKQKSDNLQPVIAL